MRLRIPDRRGDLQYFARTVKALGGEPGFFEIAARPETAGLLLLHRTDEAAVVDTGRRLSLFDVQPADDGAALRLLAARTLLRLRSMTPEALTGKVDVRTAGAAVLLGVAAIQAARGQWAGPAITHVMHAVSLVTGGGTDETP